MKLELLKHLPIMGVFRLTFARGANRLLLGGGERALIVDPTTGKEVAKLPKDAHVSAMDRAGTLAAVSEAGKTVGKRYEWNVTLWDLAKGKKIGILAECHPDDRVSPDVIGKTRILATRKKKQAYSFCLYDRTGKLVAEHRLGKVDLPFYAAMSADERLGAHAYFTGAAHLVDLTTGKSQKLDGGALRIGRQHDKGITSLAIDPSGEHVMYVSPATDTVHVWSTRTRKAVKGKWTGIALTDAFFFAGGIAVVQGSKESSITFFPLAEKGTPRTLDVGKGGKVFAESDDDRHIACAGYTGFDPWAEKGLDVWDVTTGKRAAKAAQPKGMDKVCAVGASSDRVALADRKGGVAIFAFG